MAFNGFFHGTFIVMFHGLPARTAQGGVGSFKDRKPIGEVYGGDLKKKTMRIQQ